MELPRTKCYANYRSFSMSDYCATVWASYCKFCTHAKLFIPNPAYIFGNRLHQKLSFPARLYRYPALFAVPQHGLHSIQLHLIMFFATACPHDMAAIRLNENDIFSLGRCMLNSYIPLRFVYFNDPIYRLGYTN